MLIIVSKMAPSGHGLNKHGRDTEACLGEPDRSIDRADEFPADWSAVGCDDTGGPGRTQGRPARATRVLVERRYKLSLSTRDVAPRLERPRKSVRSRRYYRFDLSACRSTRSVRVGVADCGDHLGDHTRHSDSRSGQSHQKDAGPRVGLERSLSRFHDYAGDQVASHVSARPSQRWMTHGTHCEGEWVL